VVPGPPGAGRRAGAARLRHRVLPAEAVGKASGSNPKTIFIVII